jgi:hypothetical protein
MPKDNIQPFDIRSIDVQQWIGIFEAAKDKYEERIESAETKLIRLEKFGATPDLLRDGIPHLYDGKTSEDRIREMQQWLERYHAQHLNCLRALETLKQVDAKQFAENFWNWQKNKK